MKIAVISDTHNRHRLLTIPETDLIVHCGDFSHNLKSALDFIDWFSSLNQKYKILVAGNHDEFVDEIGKEKMIAFCEEKGIIYLEDESIVIEGIKFYGSPWSVEFGNWYFMLDDLELADIWDRIDDDTDVLITHGPQYLVADRVNQDIINTHVGSKTLSLKIKKLKNLKYHLTGHIHEASGVYDKEYPYITINGAMWDYYKRDEVKEPYVFEI